MAQDDLIIGFQANTQKFQADVEKAFQVVNNFANKTYDAGTLIDKQFRSISQAAYNCKDDIQRAFGNLKIDSDFSMQVQREQLVRDKQFFQAQFEAIANDANTSAADVKRAFTALNNIHSTLDQKGSLIGLSDVEKQMVEASTLNQKFNYEKLRNEEAMRSEAIAMNQKFDLDKLRSEEKMYLEAIRMNQKFNYEKLRNEEKLNADIKIAHEQALRMNAEFNSRRIASEEASRRKLALIHNEALLMNQRFDEGKLNGQGLATSLNEAANHSGRMNANIFASIGMIAKMQVMFSLINTTMSAISRAPGAAVDAIEDFNSSVVTNAAMITSMQRGVKDVGKAYIENKQYATAVENVLVKMDAETSASAKNLRDMNNQFVQQGVLIDVNSKKQIDGFKSVANALSAITAGDPNQAMQFAQEIRALKSFEDKGSNRLVQMLRAQGVTKEMYEQWKASDTVLEEMGKRLQGFAAAQGDINNMWATVKSTMETIRDEVLRGGLAPGFAQIIEKMKEISKYAQDNKEKVQKFLKDSFADAIGVAKVFLQIGEGIAYIGQPLVWTAIGAGLYSIIGAARTFAAEMTIATGGVNLLLAGMATLAMYGGKKYFDNQALSERVTSIKKEGFSNGASFELGKLTNEKLMAILAGQPMASNKDIIDWVNKKSINLSSFSMNNDMIKWLQAENGSSIKTPKVPPPGGKDTKVADPAIAWNSFADQYNSFMISGEDEPLARKLLEIEKKANDLIFKFNELDGAKKKAFDTQNAAWGGTVGAIRDEQRQNESRAIEEAMTKRIHQNQEDQKHFDNAITAAKKKVAADEAAASLKIRNDKQQELDDQMMMIDLQEKLNKISGPEAVKERLEVQTQLVANQKEYLDAIDQQKDKSSWAKQEIIYMKEVVKLNDLLKKDYAKTFQGGAESAWAAIRDNASNTGQQVHSVLTGAFNGALESLMNFTRTGKMEFGKFTISILEMIAKITFEKAMAGIVGNAIGGIGGMFSSSSPATGATPGADGVSLSSAGYSGWSGPSFATGINRVPKDMLALIHENEAVVPAAYNPAVGGGLGSDIKIELVNQTGKEMKQKDGGMKFDGKQMIKTIILEAMDSDYSFRNAVRGG